MNASCKRFDLTFIQPHTVCVVVEKVKRPKTAKARLTVNEE